MNSNLRSIILALGMAVALAPLPGRAEPLPIDPVGARHMGLAGASAALYHGADAVYHNPASLVWQTIALGAGVNPVRWNQWPSSWWLWFYNEQTEYGWPMALVAQGWSAQADEGEAYVHMIGMPLALNMTQATPGAVDVKLAFEKRPDGQWKVQAPLDFGFLGRHPSGTTFGMVWRNVVIGANPLQTLEQRLDYGVSWGGGPLLFTAATSWTDLEEPFADARQRYRLGAEVGSPRIRLRGGYLRQDEGWAATAGLTLGSGGEMAYQVEYAAIWQSPEQSLRHYLQYVFIVP